MKSIFIRPLIWLSLGSLAACSSSGDDGSTGGTLTLALTDAPIDTVSEVWVEFSGVALKPHGDGPATQIDFTTPLRVDLLSLTDGKTELLLSNEPMPDGVYNWIELQVNGGRDGVMDSYVTTLAGGQEEMEIKVPSGTIRLVSGFTITADKNKSLLVDWDMHMGLIHVPGLGGYILRPAFRVVDMAIFGTLSGTVDMSRIVDASCRNDLNLDTGNGIYIYAGSNVMPDDIDGVDDGVDVEPIATAAVTQDSDGNYTYEVLLSPGDYTVAFTCQTSLDAANVDETATTPPVFVEPTTVTVVDGGSHTVDF